MNSDHIDTATDPKSTEANSAYKPTILLADDNAINAETITEFLRFAGYDTVVAQNGVEAVQFATEIIPDIILMDIQMPKMDGLDAIRCLRADPATAAIPIIAVTGLGMQNDSKRSLEAGADLHLVKPFGLRELSDTLANILAKAPHSAA
ncbi:MAG: response regulator [Caldilineaceae bacterium]|nr:response regulator [Caldilineaceae bacterium]